MARRAPDKLVSKSCGTSPDGPVVRSHRHVHAILLAETLDDAQRGEDVRLSPAQEQDVKNLVAMVLAPLRVDDLWGVAGPLTRSPRRRAA
jgi:hypothetical protein